MRTALHFARNLVLAYMAVLAVAIPAYSHDAPTGGWVGTDAVAAERPHAWPTWDSHGTGSGCQPLQDDVLPARVLAVTQSGETVRMRFDRAWNLNHDNEPANDVYAIGVCK